MIGITYYRQKCIGCRACAEHAPQRWRMSRKDGKAVLLEGVKKGNVYNVEVHPEELESNQTAARTCPEKCIVIRQH